MGCYPDRKTQEEVYARIIEDLNIAIEQAPGVWTYQDERGQMRHMRFWQKYATIEPHDWSKVNEHCDAVIASGFSLLPGLKFLWMVTMKTALEGYDTGLYQRMACWQPGVIDVVGTDWKKFNTPLHDLMDASDAAGDVVRKEEQ